MKTISTRYILVFLSVILFTACSKRDYIPYEQDPREWMRTHEKGVVAYVDNFTGNYIVETYQGYSVMESWGGISPREFDNVYSWFSNPGVQTIYNYDGNYFNKARVADYWLSWSDALYVLDDLSYRY